MVLTDRDLDELWRKAGTYGGKIKESLEVAEENERSSFSQVTTKLFNEYRELKAEYEKMQQKYEQLASDTRKHMDTIFKLNEEIKRLNAEGARMQQQLMQRR